MFRGAGMPAACPYEFAPTEVGATETKKPHINICGFFCLYFPWCTSLGVKPETLGMPRLGYEPSR